MTALSVDGLSKTFGGERRLLGHRRPAVQAVADVSLDVRQGETLGIVGESGSGKTTLARMLGGLLEPTAGRIEIEGRALAGRTGRNPAAFGRAIQYVFQDPVSSLNPRKTVGAILEAPLRHLHRMDHAARRQRVAEVIDALSLRSEFLARYPHEFSGGQAQRIGIARALAAAPRILLLDEPVSALDVSVQAQVLNLLADLKKRFALTYLFISHDLAVVEAVSDRVAVMYFGRIVEIGPAERLFRAPRHPYTALLAASAPAVGRAIAAEPGAAELPDPTRPLPGCAFAGRCPWSTELCRQERPALAGPDAQRSACHHPLN